jgi:tRNA pseudouridine55 synthase
MQLPNTAEAFLEGQVLLFDKPLHWTSFQLVNKVRWILRQHFQLKKIKVGHAGTLDPLATGLVIICTGKYTKRIDEFMEKPKTYDGIFRVGATTPSYDLETEIDAVFPFGHITNELIQEKKVSFIGEIEQYPPVFSAIKKDGKRLYEYARKGEEVQISSRKVSIDRFEIVENVLPDLHFEVDCSKGTYIRSLAYDFGKALHSGAHLTKLRRTKIGEHLLVDALNIEAFETFYLG